MSVVSIPDAAPAGRRLGVAWSVGNQLVVHTRRGQGAGAEMGVRAHEVRRDHAVGSWLTRVLGCSCPWPSRARRRAWGGRRTS